MIKVINTLRTYDKPSEIPDTSSYPETITIESHWNNPKLVIININGNKVTVSLEDAKIALQNATNTNRY